MRPLRGKGFALALLLSFGLSAPLRADDEAIMKGGDLLAQQQGGQQTKQENTEPQTGEEDLLPAEVEADLREQIAELESQVDELHKEIAELKALHDKDTKAFEAKLAAEQKKLDELEKQRKPSQSTGLAGKVDQVDRSVQTGRQQTTGPQTTGAPSAQGPVSQGPQAPQAPQAPRYPVPQQPSWLEVLLFKVAQGVGMGLERLMQNRLNGIYNNANQASSTLGQRYPQYAPQIQQRIHAAVGNAIQPGSAPAPVARPKQPPRRVILPVRRFVPLPRVTDEFGTHPQINILPGGTD